MLRMDLRASAFIAACMICACVLATSRTALGADAAAGKVLFGQRCGICHTAQSDDAGGAQGPSLVGVYGRRAASVPGFSFSPALRAANLIWDAPTLSRFLAAPGDVVPDTTMVVAVPAAADRDNLIAYFQDLARSVPAVATGAAAPDRSTTMTVPAASQLSADWRLDAPGRNHRIEPAALPPPFATPSTRNSPQLIARPPNAALALPPGFHIDTFAAGLKGPRKMLVSPNGDVLVSETRGGRISVLHPTHDGTRAARADVYVQGLRQPFGLAFYPNAEHPQWLYVAETNRVTRYAYRPGDVKPRGGPQTVIPTLPSGGGHVTRDVAFSPDATQLFVSVGSGSNVAESMAKKTPDQIRAWESEHGLGAAWDE